MIHVFEIWCYGRMLRISWIHGPCQQLLIKRRLLSMHISPSNGRWHITVHLPEGPPKSTKYSLHRVRGNDYINSYRNKWRNADNPRWTPGAWVSDWLSALMSMSPWTWRNNQCILKLFLRMIGDRLSNGPWMAGITTKWYWYGQIVAHQPLAVYVCVCVCEYTYCMSLCVRGHDPTPVGARPHIARHMNEWPTMKRSLV